MNPHHRNRRPHPRRGFSLLEVIIAVSIIALLATLVVPRLTKFLSGANESKAVAEVNSLANTVKLYMASETTGTLTDDFQNLAAAENAVYPVTGLRTDDVYGDVDPEPGTFATVALDWHEIGSKLDGWLDTWQQVFEDHSCTV